MAGDGARGRQVRARAPRRERRVCAAHENRSVLLAHELAHVVQERRSPDGVLRRAPVTATSAGEWSSSGRSSRVIRTLGTGSGCSKSMVTASFVSALPANGSTPTPKSVIRCWPRLGGRPKDKKTPGTRLVTIPERPKVKGSTAGMYRVAFVPRNGVTDVELEFIGEKTAAAKVVAPTPAVVQAHPRGSNAQRLLGQGHREVLERPSGGGIASFQLDRERRRGVLRSGDHDHDDQRGEEDHGHARGPAGTGTGTPAASPKKGPEVGASVEGSAKEQTIKTNVEVAVPIEPAGSVLIFGQPLVLGKELKARVGIGPQKGPGGLWLAQQQAGSKISLKALSYELEDLKSRVPGLTLGLGVTGEATPDPSAPFARPELGAKAGLETEYQIGRTPIYVQGSIVYEVKLPLEGPAEAAPAADFGQDRPALK